MTAPKTVRTLKSRKVALTLRIGEADFQTLQRLAKAENRSPTNYVETALLQNIAAKAEVAAAITMYVPADAAAIEPGPLVRTDGESGSRYAQRVALMDELFAIPDAD
jgi:predicted transcriptional regulator